MDFEFGKEVRIKGFTENTGMTGILHKQLDDGSFDVLLVHDRNHANQHVAGVLCSVVPINMPADSVEAM